MIRKQAVKLIAHELGKEPIISSNGFMSRDLFETYEKNSNFYMIGSMGLASSIGLGVALKNSKKKINIFDGDGNILMNLGSIITIGSLKPKNFVHFIFDNSSHESTGGQPTNSRNIKLENIMSAAKFKVFKINRESQIKKIIKKIKYTEGPIAVIVLIKNDKTRSIRVDLEPSEIKNRFMKSLKQK